MMARLVFLAIVSLGCVTGTWLKENTSSSQLLATPAPAEEAILLSGGSGNDALISVEVFSPSTGQSCSLPSLPTTRIRHTMDSLLICGGVYTRRTCITFSSGKWITSHHLYAWRNYHSSWRAEEGVVLMGGSYSDSMRTSEIVQMGGEGGGPSFPMQYSTRLACSMPDLTNPTVIITGGESTMQTVSRYNILGFMEDLPSLVVGRNDHGCGSYWREADGTQVFLVAGGLDSGNHRISSTEVLTTASPAWSLTTPLPRRLSALSCVTAGGKLYATGGWDDNPGDNSRDEVLAWSDEEQHWVEEGKMKVPRYFHAATTIQLDDDAMAHCG